MREVLINFGLNDHWVQSLVSASGVTWVGVTRAATDSITPIFSSSNWQTFFLLISVTYLDFTRVSPLWRCHLGQSTSLVTPLVCSDTLIDSWDQTSDSAITEYKRKNDWTFPRSLVSYFGLGERLIQKVKSPTVVQFTFQLASLHHLHIGDL